MFSLRMHKNLLLVIYLTLGQWTLSSAGSSANPDCLPTLTESVTTPQLRPETKLLSPIFAGQPAVSRQLIRYIHTDHSVGNPVSTANGSSSVYMIRQSQIKELNESLWNITGTEAYLERLYQAIHSVLANNPSYGRVLKYDFKSFVIESPLAEPIFRSRILKPVSTFLKAWLAKKNPTLKDSEWKTWVDETLLMAKGLTPEDAHFRLIQQDPSFNFNSWQTQALARRTRLKAAVETAGVQWSELIQRLHQNVAREKGGKEAFKYWLRTKGLEQSNSDALAYLRDLQMADFNVQKPQSSTSLPYHWALERRVQFEKAKRSGFVAAIDIEGLGLVSRHMQNDWLIGGAKVSELPFVYEKSTRAITQAYSHLMDQLTALGAKPILYRTEGDDSVLFLEKTLDPILIQAYVKILEAITTRFYPVPEHPDLNIHFYLSDLIPVARQGKPDSIAQALFDARASLNKKKVPPLQ